MSDVIPTNLKEVREMLIEAHGDPSFLSEAQIAAYKAIWKADDDASRAEIKRISDQAENRAALEKTIRCFIGGELRNPGSDRDLILGAAIDENEKYVYQFPPDHIRDIFRQECEHWDRIRKPITPVKEQMTSLTELGNSERFIAKNWEQILYCTQMRSWLIWDGKIWRQDVADGIRILAKKTVRALYGLASSPMISDERKREFLKHATKSESARSIAAFLELSKCEVPIDITDLDKHANLFNVRNGTIELDTLKFREHRKEDYLTKLADVDFVDGEKCRHWEQHLTRIFAGDQELIDAFQQMCGYSLLADNPSEVMFILHGKTANGKTKTLEVLSTIWGDYAQTVDASKVLIARKYEGPRTELACLVGSRLVTASEGKEGGRLDEAVIKQITGRDAITVRKLYQDEFTYVPGYKLWYATNHKPTISTDEAVWRRIWLVPFTVTIPLEERDESIAVKLLEERSGILNWALEGLRKYNRNGRRLVQPEAVKVATSEYHSDMDVIARFVDAECVITGSPKDRERRGDLYAWYVSWSRDNGETPSSQKKFAKHLVDHGVIADPSVAHITNERNERVVIRFWSGIRAKFNDEKITPNEPLTGVR